MSTFLLFTLALVFSLWLILRARAHLQNNAQNAALLAQLEAMDADLTRLEINSQNTDRELQKLDRSERPKGPRSEPAKPPTQPEATEEQSTLPQIPSSSSSPSPSEPPPETTIPNPTSKQTNPNPTRKRGTPKSIEEYETTRKRLPPSPVYIPSAKALAHFDELYNVSPQPAPADISVNSRPFAVENAHKRKPTLLDLCLARIRIAARCLTVVLAPARHITKIFSRFFTRPKPPPITPGAQHERRAA